MNAKGNLEDSGDSVVQPPKTSTEKVTGMVRFRSGNGTDPSLSSTSPLVCPKAMRRSSASLANEFPSNMPLLPQLFSSVEQLSEAQLSSEDNATTQRMVLFTETDLYELFGIANQLMDDDEHPMILPSANDNAKRRMEDAHPASPISKKRRLPGVLTPLTRSKAVFTDDARLLRDETPVPLLTPPDSPVTVTLGNGDTTTVCEWPSNLIIDAAIMRSTDDQVLVLPDDGSSLDNWTMDKEELAPLQDDPIK